MANMENTNVQLLISRVERNYEDFKSETLEFLDKESIFGIAEYIAAVEDARAYINTHDDWLDEDDAGYLLGFDNPLEMLADIWAEYRSDGDAIFKTALDELLERDDNEDFYISVIDADELREKYGEDMPIKGAIIGEILELNDRINELERYCCGGPDEWGAAVE